MTQRIVYWGSTVIAALALFMSVTYLTGSEQVVAGFQQAGYPQHLRIVLGIAKPLAAIVLVLPRLPVLKEWAYAGASFALAMATLSAYLTGGPGAAILPVLLLALLLTSYITRPADRRLGRSLLSSV